MQGNALQKNPPPKKNPQKKLALQTRDNRDLREGGDTKNWKKKEKKEKKTKKTNPVTPKNQSMLKKKKTGTK